MSNNNSSNSSKLLLVITGASRGLGRAIALAFCQPQQPLSLQAVQEIHVLLIARQESGLLQTKQEIEAAAGATGSPSTTIVVSCVVLDLGDLSNLENAVERDIIAELTRMASAATGTDTDSSEQELVFINNAGSLGRIGPVVETLSLPDMQREVDFNITSALYLSARMAKFAHEMNCFSKTTIVNISSLVAVQAFPTFALYSAGKAARDLYHSAMAEEMHGLVASKKASKIQIVSYAPGPLETDMATEIRQDPKVDANLKPNFEKQLLDPNDSAARLVKLVRTGNFGSGQHVDYYDLDEPSFSSVEVTK